MASNLEQIGVRMKKPKSKGKSKGKKKQGQKKNKLQSYRSSAEEFVGRKTFIGLEENNLSPVESFSQSIRLAIDKEYHFNPTHMDLGFLALFDFDNESLEKPDIVIKFSEFDPNGTAIPKGRLVWKESANVDVKQPDYQTKRFRFTVPEESKIVLKETGGMHAVSISAHLGETHSSSLASFTFTGSKTVKIPLYHSEKHQHYVENHIPRPSLILKFANVPGTKDYVLTGIALEIKYTGHMVLPKQSKLVVKSNPTLQYQNNIVAAASDISSSISKLLGIEGKISVVAQVGENQFARSNDETTFAMNEFLDIPVRHALNEHLDEDDLDVQVHASGATIGNLLDGTHGMVHSFVPIGKMLQYLKNGAHGPTDDLVELHALPTNTFTTISSEIASNGIAEIASEILGKDMNDIVNETMSRNLGAGVVKNENGIFETNLLQASRIASAFIDVDSNNSKRISSMEPKRRNSRYATISTTHSGMTHRIASVLGNNVPVYGKVDGNAVIVAIPHLRLAGAVYADNLSSAKSDDMIRDISQVLANTAYKSVNSASMCASNVDALSNLYQYGSLPANYHSFNRQLIENAAPNKSISSLLDAFDGKVLGRVHVNIGEETHEQVCSVADIKIAKQKYPNTFSVIDAKTELPICSAMWSDVTKQWHTLDSEGFIASGPKIELNVNAVDNQPIMQFGDQFLSTPKLGERMFEDLSSMRSKGSNFDMTTPFDPTKRTLSVSSEVQANRLEVVEHESRSRQVAREYGKLLVPCNIGANRGGGGVSFGVGGGRGGGVGGGFSVGRGGGFSFGGRTGGGGGISFGSRPRTYIPPPRVSRGPGIYARRSPSFSTYGSYRPARRSWFRPYGSVWYNRYPRIYNYPGYIPFGLSALFWDSFIYPYGWYEWDDYRRHQYLLQHEAEIRAQAALWEAQQRQYSYDPYSGYY